MFLLLPAELYITYLQNAVYINTENIRLEKKSYVVVLLF
jgi:hypothetical protein